MAGQPGGGITLPSGTRLTPRAVQMLGLSGLGSGGGLGGAWEDGSRGVEGGRDMCGQVGGLGQSVGGDGWA